jgi:hypothetical protein
MEYEILLPCVQNNAPFPYTKPDESCPQPSISLKSPWIYCSHLQLGLLSDFFHILPPKLCWDLFFSSTFAKRPAHIGLFTRMIFLENDELRTLSLCIIPLSALFFTRPIYVRALIRQFKQYVRSEKYLYFSFLETSASFFWSQYLNEFP